MADYWKSQARKFCEFCKCWIADNKPSIQYHENGKRHKENVSKKLSEMFKKSAKQHKENAKLDNEMKKMEEEALKAYMKDIASSADYTSQQLAEKLSEKEEENSPTEQKKIAKEKKEIPKKVLENSKEWKTKNPINEKLEAPAQSQSSWYEGKSEQGHLYYWNMNTAESRWEKPEEGYVSLIEQEKQNEIQTRSTHLEMELMAKEKAEEVRAYQQRESMKNLKQVREMHAREEEEEKRKKEMEEDVGSVVMGPQPKVDPYGSWTTVERVKPKQIDLQLPQCKSPSISIMHHVQMAEQIEEEEKRPKLIITEKRITSLDSDETDGIPIIFKKRKVTNANFRRRKGNIEDENEDQD